MTPQPYPITELFAWIIDDPSGKLAIIGVSPGGMPMQAVSSKRHLIQTEPFRTLAESVAKQTGYPVRLQRFTLAETMLEFKADAPSS